MAAIADTSRFIVPPNEFHEPSGVIAAGEGDDVVDNGESLRQGLIAYRESHRLAEFVAHAAAIDTRVDLAKVRKAPVFATTMFGRGFGLAYHELCRRLVPSRFDAVLVVSSLAEVPQSLVRMAATPGRWLVVEMARGAAPSDALPDDARAIALDAFGEWLPAPRRAEMTLRLVHAFAARACLHLVRGGDGDALVDTFAEAFERNNVVVYVFARDGRQLASELGPAAYSAIDLLVSDDETILDDLVALMPIYAPKVMSVPRLADEKEMFDWLARVRRRLPCRPEETRWMST